MQQHATNDKQMLCVVGKQFGSFDRGLMDWTISCAPSINTEIYLNQLSSFRSVVFAKKYIEFGRGRRMD